MASHLGAPIASKHACLACTFFMKNLQNGQLFHNFRPLLAHYWHSMGAPVTHPKPLLCESWKFIVWRIDTSISQFGWCFGLPHTHMGGPVPSEEGLWLLFHLQPIIFSWRISATQLCIIIWDYNRSATQSAVTTNLQSCQLLQHHSRFKLLVAWQSYSVNGNFSRYLC